MENYSLYIKLNLDLRNGWAVNKINKIKPNNRNNRNGSRMKKYMGENRKNSNNEQSPSHKEIKKQYSFKILFYSPKKKI